MAAKKEAKTEAKKEAKAKKPTAKSAKKTPLASEGAKLDIQKTAADLYKKGYSPSKIGIELRDKHGIPSVKRATGNKLHAVLKSEGISPETPEDLVNLIRRATVVSQHLSTNKKDNVSRRGLQLTESKIRRIVKYYKSTGRLPKSWEYDLSKSKLLIE
ncbi:MAG: 30S ribosomal protein S15 [archaeon]